MKNPFKTYQLACFSVFLFATISSKSLLAQGIAGDSSAIKAVVNRFYDGWNSHDVEKMVSVYSKDVDHVNAFGEWHHGKEVMREVLTKFHADRTKNIAKTLKFEKIRFLKPDVAVALVRQFSTVGNIGTFVLSKESGEWLVVSFSNVPYKLQESATKGN